MKILDEYIKSIEHELRQEKLHGKTDEVGIVQEVRDGIAILAGLDNVGYGEVIKFESGVSASVIDLTQDTVGAIVLGDYLKIKEGESAKAIGQTLSIPVSNLLLGRVVDPLGQPLDGKPRIKSNSYNPLEKIAPGVVTRQGVNVSLQTGIKAIDALVPIGRGQRELIIGDRGTGKTTIAIDTILNQEGQDIICIYCAVGQKNSNVASTVELLEKSGALKYSIIVSASASSPASFQYLAPYAACAIGEYFMDKGKDVLVVYDDLSKHAWAYRQISLILRRPAGREAYPGDVFYLHSRLLERACRLNKEHGNGSLTALPIIETLEGDVSAYIPTNVISITDGQIVLDADLFNSGVRPAINVGLSVSRVGGDAQTKAMKSVASRLKLDLAQYREMAAFAQFESELDPETKKFLNRGSRMIQIIKQNKHEPYSLAKEVAIIWAASNGFLDELPVDKISEFERRLMRDLAAEGKQLLTRINKNKLIDKKDEDELKKFIAANLKL